MNKFVKMVLITLCLTGVCMDTAHPVSSYLVSVLLMGIVGYLCCKTLPIGYRKFSLLQTLLLCGANIYFALYVLTPTIGKYFSTLVGITVFILLIVLAIVMEYDPTHGGKEDV